MKKLLYFSFYIFVISCSQSEISNDRATAGISSAAIAEIPAPQAIVDTNPKLKPRKMFRDSSQVDLFPTIPMHLYDSIFRENFTYFVDGFDYPVGIPNANDYFLALHFGQERHLGEDWNGIGGGNTDLGDPVFAIGNGLVTFSKEVCCGWGNVVRVVHRLPNHPEYDYIESVYAHLQNIQVKPGDLIRRGDKIGGIGTANGRYLAHLHLELRSFINMSLGPGYSDDRFGYLDPSAFIGKHRP